MKVVIIGGGISGLSCAYDLNKKNFDVEIYERNDTFGGQSRSIEYGRCSIEYAWRVWTEYYYNFIDICKSIPISNNKTIFDNLVSCCNKKYNTDNLNINKWNSKLEYYRLLFKLIQMILMSDTRLKNTNIAFFDYINPKEQATIDFCDEFVGPIIGVEARKATLYNVSKGWQITYLNTNNPFKLFNSKIYVTNAPYEDAIFKHWYKYLSNNGVKLFNNTSITKINYNKNLNKIESVETNNSIITADDFVFCLDQTAMAKLIINNNDLLNLVTFNNISKLPKYGNEYYLGLRIFFNKEVDLDFDSGTCTDQPWKPVIQRFNKVWKKKYLNKCNSKEIWQVSVFNFVKGHNNLILQDCSLEEAVKEIFYQLKSSNLISKLKTIDGNNIWDSMITYQVWPYWDNDINNKIYNTMDEYKLSINKGVYELMPNIQTEIDNLYIGSVIAKYNIPMVSQEVACTNGRIAASLICKKYNRDIPNIKYHYGTGHIVLYPIRLLDKLLFKLGLDISHLFILFCILLILKFLNKI